MVWPRSTCWPVLTAKLLACAYSGVAAAVVDHHKVAIAVVPARFTTFPLFAATIGAPSMLFPLVRLMSIALWSLL